MGARIRFRGGLREVMIIHQHQCGLGIGDCHFELEII